MDTLYNLQREMKNNGIEAALVMDDAQRLYLCGFKSSAGFMLIFRDDAYLFVDFRYFEAAKAQADGYNVVLMQKSVSAHTAEVLEQRGIGTLHFEDRVISFFDFNTLEESLMGIELLGMDSLISDLRMVKTPRELSFIKQAQRESEKALLSVLGCIKEGMSELEFSLILEWEIRAANLGTSFDFIVVGGENTAKPHGVPTERKFRRGEFITVDFGAKYMGYCADMTRTFCLGSPTDEMRLVYDTVKTAKEKAQQAVRSGVIGSDVDAAARKVIEDAGYGECFGHSLGHGVGVEVHEQPSFAPKYKGRIPKGAVVSVEPGIYLEGRFGVRIEDLVAVTDEGYENLNSLDTKLIEL